MAGAANYVRLAVGALSLSAAGLVGLVTLEGYTDRAVIPIPGDVPTIGFGSTEGVKLGDRTTPVRALERAMRDVQKHESAIRQCVRVPLSQAEYDAYAELSYNIGSRAFCTSTIVKRLNAENYSGACEAILMWRYAAGKDCSNPANKCLGLWKRRLLAFEACSAKP